MNVKDDEFSRNFENFSKLHIAKIYIMGLVQDFKIDNMKFSQDFPENFKHNGNSSKNDINFLPFNYLTN